MKHLHYWIDLKKAIAKIKKEATFWKQSLGSLYFLRCYTFKSIHIASSAGNNKAITRENDCLPCVYLPLALVDLGPLEYLRSELFVTKAISWNLLLLLQKLPFYVWQGS